MRSKCPTKLGYSEIFPVLRLSGVYMKMKTEICCTSNVFYVSDHNIINQAAFIAITTFFYP